MAKEWCVSGLKLSFTINGLDVTETGVISISSVPSNVVKVNNKGVYAGTFNVTFSGSTYNGYTQTAPAVFAISCGAQYSKAENQPIMLVEDTQTVGPIPFQMGQSSASYSIKCAVKNPGQDVVKEL